MDEAVVFEESREAMDGSSSWEWNAWISGCWLLLLELIHLIVAGNVEARGAKAPLRIAIGARSWYKALGLSQWHK